MITQRRSKGTPLKILSVRPLVESDLEALRAPSHRTNISKLRDSHHAIARYYAQGLKASEIADITGYTLARLSILRSDPAVAELVAHYRNLITEDWRAEQDALTALATRNMIAAERQLADKLDDADANGELLPTRELLAITSDRMDRFGYGKHTSNLNVNVDFAAKLERAIALQAQTKKLAAE